MYQFSFERLSIKRYGFKGSSYKYRTYLIERYHYIETQYNGFLK